MSVQQPLGAQAIEGVFAGLTALLAGALVGAKVHLYKQGFAPTAQNVYADYLAQECNFTGYAPSVLTWSSVGYDSMGNPFVLSVRTFFQATDAVAPNTVGGVFITSEVTGPPAIHTVLEWYPLNPQVAMTTALASMGVVIAMMQPGNNGYSIVDY